MGKFFICCRIHLKFRLRVRLKCWNDWGEFEIDRAKSKNNIAEYSFALGHETHYIQYWTVLHWHPFRFSTVSNQVPVKLFYFIISTMFWDILITLSIVLSQESNCTIICFCSYISHNIFFNQLKFRTDVYHNNLIVCIMS